MPDLVKERCGLIFENGDVLELVNKHPSPEDNFVIYEDDLFREGVVGTFHTHPRSSANLTVTDYYAFRQYPQLRHYIISPVEIWCFHMINGILCRYENSNLPRFPQDLMPPKLRG